jgi:hypothetical protein
VSKSRSSEIVSKSGGSEVGIKTCGGGSFLLWILRVGLIVPLETAATRIGCSKRNQSSTRPTLIRAYPTDKRIIQGDAGAAITRLRSGLLRMR